MPVLSNPQVASLRRMLAGCNQVLPRIELLEALANVNPNIRQKVADLRAMREYLCQLATTALEIDRQMVPSGAPSAPAPAGMPMVSDGAGGMIPAGGSTDGVSGGGLTGNLIPISWPMEQKQLEAADRQGYEPVEIRGQHFLRPKSTGPSWAS